MSTRKTVSASSGMMVVGVGVGVALGIAMDNIPVYLALGIALGLIFGAGIDMNRRRKPEE
jgi:uncharacterized membrane protein YfcA